MESSPKKAASKPAKLPPFKSARLVSAVADVTLPALRGIGEAVSGAPLPLRGLSTGKAGWMDRLRALRPRELALVMAGLGVLAMAPISEYMSSSSDEGGALKTGFAQRSGGVFGDSPNPYEDGLHGIAQGGLIGRDGEAVVTPNSASNPLNMIVHAEGAPEGSPAVPAAESAPKKEEAPAASGGSSWTEAITAAKSGMKAAAKNAPGLPRPGEKLSTTLRGLAAAAGGGGATATSGASAPKLDGLSSKGLVSGPSQISSLHQIQSAPGYKGAANRGLASGSGNPGGGRGGSGVGGSGGSLLQDVSGGVHGGGTALPGGSQASEQANANPSVTSAKDARTQTPSSTENLNQLRAKMEMQKQIDLKYAKMQYDQLDRKKMLEQITAQTLAQTASQGFLKLVDKALNPNGPPGQGQQGQGGQGAGPGAGPNAGPPSNPAGPASVPAVPPSSALSFDQLKAGGVPDAVLQTAGVSGAGAQPMYGPPGSGLEKTVVGFTVPDAGGGQPTTYQAATPGDPNSNWKQYGPGASTPDKVLDKTGSEVKPPDSSSSSDTAPQ